MICCVVAAGCGRFAFEPLASTGTSDATTTADTAADACAFGPWGTPIDLGPSVNSNTEDFSPALTGGDMTLVWESLRGGTNYDLYEAKRTSPTAPFGGVRALTTVNSNGNDEAPTITADGLTMYFVSDRSGSLFLWRATRATLADDWGTPARVSELTTPVQGPAISSDGNELFFTTVGATAKIQRSVNVGGVFRTPTDVPELSGPLSNDEDGWPALSADGLTIYWEAKRTGNDLNTYVATRPSVGAAFTSGAPLPIASLLGVDENDPEISHDGTQLFIAKTGGTQGADDLFVATRSCL